MNVDDGVGVEDRVRGIGGIIRDATGAFQGALAMPAPSLISILATKLHAILKSLEFSLDLGYLSLVVVLDSL